MSDRLTELQRQRALAQEQLAWFDREIAREQGLAPAAPAAPPPPAAVAPAPVAPAPASAAEIDRTAAEIMSRFKEAKQPVHDDVRRGCFMYFFAALALLALAVYAFYVLHHPPGE